MITARPSPSSCRPTTRASTLQATVDELPAIVDHRILVDDGSRDGTAAVARELGLTTFVHDANYGYGRNQMTCYREALRAGADIVVMVHPDYQYTPRLVTAMASMIAYDVYDVVLGLADSRWHGALRAECRSTSTSSNRLPDRHGRTCCSARSCRSITPAIAPSAGKVLETLPLLENSDDFVFDNQMLTQCLYFGFRDRRSVVSDEVFPEASSINFRRSVQLTGFGVLKTAMQCMLQRRHVRTVPHFRIRQGAGWTRRKRASAVNHP